MTRPLWNPEYAALVARRNAGIREVGKRAIETAYRQRQAFAVSCDCDALVVDPTQHRDWCGWRLSSERPPPIYDPQAQAEMAAVIEKLKAKGPVR